MLAGGAGARRRPQLRRRQRLHRARGLPGHPRHRRARRRRSSASAPIDVAVCSTGLIGVRLPMDKLPAGVDRRGRRRCAEDGGADAARAIMTTDTRAQDDRAAAATAGTVGGMAKGAGHARARPGHDARRPHHRRRRRRRRARTPALRRRPASRFDRVDSDGCMSTNDTVLCWPAAPAGSRRPPRSSPRPLTAACHRPGRCSCSPTPRARPRTSRSTVRNAASERGRASRSAGPCARNNLLKTALFGNDPNWGRVLAAVGTTDAAFEADQVDVAINGVGLPGRRDRRRRARASTSPAGRSPSTST